ncbi:MAG: hypothetical protein KAQ68_10045 [Clostridiales bacterium]|nr:hypothetical protein [Clostridiales bacterium]
MINVYMLLQKDLYRFGLEGNETFKKRTLAQEGILDNGKIIWGETVIVQVNGNIQDFLNVFDNTFSLITEIPKGYIQLAHRPKYGHRLRLEGIEQLDNLIAQLGDENIDGADTINELKLLVEIQELKKISTTENGSTVESLEEETEFLALELLVIKEVI